MTAVAAHQAANVVPPRRGQVLSFLVDSTARSYPIHHLELAGYVQDASASKSSTIFVHVQADQADVYFYLSSVDSADINGNAGIALSSPTVAFDNSYAWKLAANQLMPIRIERRVDRYLVLRSGSGAGFFRLFASSEPQF